MQPRMTIAVLLAASLFCFSGAASAQLGARPEVRQIQLTEKQVQGTIAAQKDVSAVFDKIQAPPPDELPPAVLAELDAVAKKHGFRDFNDYDEVLGNITQGMTGLHAKTNAVTQPAPPSTQEAA